MPVYEYECSKCGKVHEVSQKMADKPLTKCPGCGGKVSKLISLSSVAVKGGSREGNMPAEACPMAGSCCAGGRCGSHGE